MKRNLAILFIAALFCSTAGYAQEASISAEVKQAYNAIKNNLTKMADKMPEEHYGFKPVPEIRTFGELVGHVAGSQARTCSAVNGEPKTVNAKATAKADLVAALKEAFAICDQAYDSLTDANATQVVKMGQRSRTKLGALVANTTHDNEEYGYMAVYLRLKNIVPPSSEGR